MGNTIVGCKSVSLASESSARCHSKCTCFTSRYTMIQLIDKTKMFYYIICIHLSVTIPTRLSLISRYSYLTINHIYSNEVTSVFNGFSFILGHNSNNEGRMGTDALFRTKIFHDCALGHRKPPFWKFRTSPTSTSLRRVMYYAVGCILSMPVDG